uniref:Uncharacterized protein n=1 Tax=Arundo donax TaxID=35708 RepID=A0A0A9EG73_ARUDO
MKVSPVPIQISLVFFGFISKLTVTQLVSASRCEASHWGSGPGVHNL